MNKLITQLALPLFAFSCANAVPILTMDPLSAHISGTPGQTVGWGFTVTNDTPFFLLFDSSQFCQPTQDPQFGPCTQTLGTYTDYIANNFTTVAPHRSTTETFDLTNMTGIGSYTINTIAPAFATDSGRVIATYMEYQGDPNNGGTQASGDIEISAAASVTVATPEPSSVLLLAAGLLALGAAARGRLA